MFFFNLRKRTIFSKKGEEMGWKKTVGWLSVGLREEERSDGAENGGNKKKRKWGFLSWATRGSWFSSLSFFLSFWILAFLFIAQRLEIACHFFLFFFVWKDHVCRCHLDMLSSMKFGLRIEMSWFCFYVFSMLLMLICLEYSRIHIATI